MEALDTWSAFVWRLPQQVDLGMVRFVDWQGPNVAAMNMTLTCPAYNSTGHTTDGRGAAGLQPTSSGRKLRGGGGAGTSTAAPRSLLVADEDEEEEAAAAVWTAGRLRCASRLAHTVVELREVCPPPAVCACAVCARICCACVCVCVCARSHACLCMIHASKRQDCWGYTRVATHALHTDGAGAARPARACCS